MTTGPLPSTEQQEPASTRLVAVLSADVFFQVRIRSTLQQLGFTVALAKTVPAFASVLHDSEPKPALGIVDFNLPVDWTAISGVMPADVPVLAFGPHKDVEGFRAAKRAGVVRVIANGEFVRSLPDLVERYAARRV